jgi:hypothetical protein
MNGPPRHGAGERRMGISVDEHGEVSAVAAEPRGW